jgi:hypothetical protein
LAFLLLGSAAAFSQDATLQSSTQVSTLSEPLWQALLPIALQLPNSFDLWRSTTQQQVQAQLANNEQLASSNLSLQTSNSSLMQENADLRTSLSASQTAEATSESKLEALQKDLSDSTTSTTQAQKSAQSLEFSRSLSQYIAFAAVGAAGGAVAGKGNLVDTAVGAGAGFVVKLFLSITHLW